MTLDRIIYGWALALRDLTNQGAVAATIALPGDITITHTGHKTRIIIPGQQPVTLTDDDLDGVKFEPSPLAEAVENGWLEVENA